MEGSATPAPGLVQKDVTFVREGKTVTEKKWVKPESPLNPNRHRAQKQEPKGKEHKMHEKALASLKEKQAELDSLKEGETKLIDGVKATKLDADHFGFVSSGKRLVAVGAHSGAVILDYLTRATASGASMATGDMQGSSTREGQQSARRMAEKMKVRSAQEKAKAKAKKQQAKAKAESEKRSAEGEARAERSHSRQKEILGDKIKLAEIEASNASKNSKG